MANFWEIPVPAQTAIFWKRAKVIIWSVKSVFIPSIKNVYRRICLEIIRLFTVKALMKTYTVTEEVKPLIP